MNEILNFYDSDYNFISNKVTVLKNKIETDIFFNETKKLYICCCKFCDYSNI